MPVGGESRSVILLVGSDRATYDCLVAALPDRSVERAPATTEVLSMADDPDVVFVDADAVDDGADPASLRDETGGAALVAIADPETTVDGSVFDDRVMRPLDAKRVRYAAEQAILAREYRVAVSELYELCEARARDDPDAPAGDSAEIRAARLRADERLAAFREGSDDEFDRLFGDE